MKPFKILLIEDDLKIAKLLEEYLRGFQFVTSHFANSMPALQKLEKEDFDLVLLDVMLPDLDGFEVLRRIRKNSSVPVIMLTARGETTDKVVGLEMGADDYLAKPFEPRELVARMQALLRRTQPLQGEKVSTLTAEELILQLGARKALFKGKDLQLTTHEFDLLKLLMQNSGKVLTRDLIMDQLTGIEAAAFDRSIDIAISRLRQKLGDNPKDSEWIKTVWGQGYLFIKVVQ